MADRTARAVPSAQAGPRRPGQGLFANHMEHRSPLAAPSTAVHVAFTSLAAHPRDGIHWVDGKTAGDIELDYGVALLWSFHCILGLEFWAEKDPVTPSPRSRARAKVWDAAAKAGGDGAALGGAISVAPGVDL